MEPSAALLALIVIPLAAAFVLLWVPSERKDWVRYLSAIVGATCFLLSLYVFIAFKTGGDQFPENFDLRIDWIENVGILGEHGISLHLGVDGIAAVMLLLNGVVAFAGVLISWKIENKNKDFFILYWVLVTGVFGTFSSLDLFMFFFFYELAVLPMYMLIAIFATFNEAGLGTFDLTALYGADLDTDFQKWVFPLFAIGAGCLAGLWPFHTWSPDGHVAAPTAVSMLHAGVLMKLGAFAILRLGIQLMPEGAEFWMPALVVLATINIIYGAISAMAQTDFKYVIGYSSVSHMGYVLLGLATLDPVGVNGAALQMFSHGVMTALMFAMVGALYDQAHTRELALFGGLAGKMPKFAVYFIIAGLTSVGLPGLSGFIAEFNVFVGTFQEYWWAGALAVLGAGITAVYIFRLLALSFFGQFNEERWGSLKDMTRYEAAGGALLIVFIVFMGLWPDPFVDRISDTVVNHLPGIG